jgi:putative hydrolase of the HAD superfamily
MGMMRETQSRSAIFIDLDDTLVDTFGLLITPLEQQAASVICRCTKVPFTASQLTAILLELRTKTPAGLRDELRLLLGAAAEPALALRDRVFAEFSIDALAITPEIVALLKQLSADHVLVLVTEGRADIQKRKIQHLQIENLFDDILVIDPSTRTDKEFAINKYLHSRHMSPQQAIVVGNRLDREIAAGNRLGTVTVWLRSGEGREMSPEEPDTVPDAVIHCLGNLPAVIRGLAGRRR